MKISLRARLLILVFVSVSVIICFALGTRIWNEKKFSEQRFRIDANRLSQVIRPILQSMMATENYTFIRQTIDSLIDDNPLHCAALFDAENRLLAKASAALTSYPTPSLQAGS